MMMDDDDAPVQHDDGDEYFHSICEGDFLAMRKKSIGDDHYNFLQLGQRVFDDSLKMRNEIFFEMKFQDVDDVACQIVMMISVA